MGGVPIRPRLMAYLAKQAGGLIIPDDVARDIGESHKRVVNGLGNMVSDAIVPGLTRVSAGVYQYYPPKELPTAVEQEVTVPTRQLFELVGTTEQFGTIVRGEDDKLYRIEPL